MEVSWALLANAVIAGLLLGGFYAAMSVGISISFGMLVVVNIAHPAFIILGSYIAYIVHDRFGYDPIAGSVVAPPLFFLLGIVPSRSYHACFERRGQERLRSRAFFLGLLAAAGVAGAFLIVIQPVQPAIGREFIGLVFAVCVLGGMGSILGTLLGAFVLGLAESFTSTFFGPSWAPAVSFGLLLATLAFRPSGILGR